MRWLNKLLNPINKDKLIFELIYLNQFNNRRSDYKVYIDGYARYVYCSSGGFDTCILYENVELDVLQVALVMIELYKGEDIFFYISNNKTDKKTYYVYNFKLKTIKKVIK